MNNDLISRKALKREFGYTDEWYKGRTVCAIIDNAPTVEQPKGKWISHYDYCSKHGVLPSSLIAFWWCEQCEQAVEQPTNFCPNCGADMRGEKE